MVNNYGDRRVRPQDLGLWDPFHSWPFYDFLWLVNGGLINYLLTGMTLNTKLATSKTPKVAVWRRDAFSLESAAKDKKSSPKASGPFL